MAKGPRGDLGFSLSSFLLFCKAFLYFCFLKKAVLFFCFCFLIFFFFFIVTFRPSRFVQFLAEWD